MTERSDKHRLKVSIPEPLAKLTARLKVKTSGRIMPSDRSTS